LFCCGTNGADSARALRTHSRPKLHSKNRKDDDDKTQKMNGNIIKTTTPQEDTT